MIYLPLRKLPSVMKQKKKFKRLFCPKCKMDTKHERIENALLNPSFRYGLGGWKCKKCGNIIAEPKEPFIFREKTNPWSLRQRSISLSITLSKVGIFDFKNSAKNEDTALDINQRKRLSNEPRWDISSNILIKADKLENQCQIAINSLSIEIIGFKNVFTAFIIVAFHLPFSSLYSFPVTYLVHLKSISSICPVGPNPLTVCP